MFVGVYDNQKGGCMVEWWDSLVLFQRVYACIAVTATLVLVIQTVLVIFGIGDGDGEVEFDLDGLTDGPDGLSLFSIRGIASFFSIGGWAGLALYEAGLASPWIIVLSLLAGAAALFGIALLVKWLKKLQSDGTLQMQNAVGKTGSVYITVPANKARTGKVMVSFQGKLNECEAVTETGRDLRTGESVKVVDILGENVLIVTPENAET